MSIMMRLGMKKRANSLGGFLVGEDLDFLLHDPDVEAERLDMKITIALAATEGSREKAARVLGLGIRSLGRLIAARRKAGHRVPGSSKPLTRYA